MLARASSDAGTRLRRSKSTSTVHRPMISAPQSLDPDIVQQQALAAATKAFARANHQNNTDRDERRSSGLSRAKSNASRKSLKSQGSHFPPRESGFRSLQPLKDKKLSTAKSASQLPKSGVDDPQFQYATPTLEENLPIPPSVGLMETSRPSSQPKAYRPSASSSVTSQQLRKARSMYYASSVQTGSPIARPPVKYLTTPPPISTSPTIVSGLGPLPVQTSGPSPLTSPRLPVTIEPGTTVDEARDKYLRTFQQRSVKHRPSLFLAPFRKRQDKSKAKTGQRASSRVMSTSTSAQETSADTTTEFTLSDFMPQKDKKEKRSLSNSIKNKIKKVFRRSSNSRSAVPVQQVEASRDYFHSVQRSPVSSNESLEIPSPDDETLQRIRSRVLTPEAGGRLFRPKSRGSNTSSQSNRSFHSDGVPSTSRISSWGSSSAGDTLTQRAIKRLTVIHEAKDSIGSEADRDMILKPPKKRSNQSPSSSTFQKTVNLDSLMEEDATPIDPKRVFSTLMKEINLTKATQHGFELPDLTGGATSDVFQASGTKELQLDADRDQCSIASQKIRSSMSSDRRPSSRCNVEHGILRRKASSVKSFGRSIKSTIRTVTPTKSSPPTNCDGPGSVRGAVRIPRPDTVTSSTLSNSDSCDEDDTNAPRLINFKFGHKRNRAHTSPADLATPPAAIISQRVQRSKNRWQAPLEESDIPRFPHLTKTSIKFTDDELPIRMPSEKPAVLEQSQLEKPTTITSAENHTTLICVPPESPKSPAPRQLLSPLSPSVYSRNTDGASILPNESEISLDDTADLKKLNEGGSVINITCETVRSYVIGTPSPRRNTSSTRSSRDWNAWLSHEVSELSCFPQENIIIDEQYTTPSGQRRRECMRTGGDDTTVIYGPTETPTLQRDTSQPKTPQQGNTVAEGNMASNVSFHAIPTPTEAEEPKVCLPLTTPPIPRRQCPSSTHSQGSSQSSQSRVETPRWERMNERFPFIETGRRSSSYSARHSRHTQTPTSGSSSLKSKATPSPKIYSDFSPSPMNQVSSQAPPDRLKMFDDKSNQSQESVQSQHNKENTAPSSIRMKRPSLSILRPGTSLSITRAKLLQPLSASKLNHSPSTLVQYTTSSEDEINMVKPNLAVGNTLSRSSVYAQLRPGKLTVRPKSAYNLRGTNPPFVTPDSRDPLVQKVEMSKISESIVNENCKPAQRRSLSGRTLDRELLRNIMRPSWATSDPSCPNSSPDPIKPRRSMLHLRKYSSTLALNKEPSPELEKRCIDSVIDDEKRPNSARSTRSGSVTPGQRMAERFLRRRKESNKDLRPASVASWFKREDTPAFL